MIFRLIEIAEKYGGILKSTTRGLLNSYVPFSRYKRLLNLLKKQN